MTGEKSDVAGIDEGKGKVQLSLLPLSDIEKRDAMWRQNRGNQKKSRKPQPKKNEPVTMEDATARLLERFGKKH